MSEQYNQSAAEIAAIAAALAEEDDDMTEATKGGGFEERLLPEGYTVARLTSYIEKGKHVELFQGKAKDPALMFTLGFELFSPNYLNEDGTPYFIETYDMARSRNEKAKAFKLFAAMNFTGKHKNFAQMLGQTFLVKIKHHTPRPSATNPNPSPRNAIDAVEPGLDKLTGNPYGCPEPTKLFLFSWTKPTLAAWDSFYIDGLNDKGQSKNWKQEKIAGATDFAGSPLEALLVANGKPIPKGTPQKQAPSAGASPAGAQPAGAAPAAPAGATPTGNVAAASVPATPPAAAVAPAAPSAPVVAATPVVQAAAPAVPVVAAAAPAVSPVVAPANAGNA